MRQLRRARSSAIVPFAVISILAIASPALASKNATPAQVKSLTRAARATPVAGINTIPTNRYVVSRAKISTVSPSWAAAWLEPGKRYRNTFQSIEVLAVKLAGTGSWAVVDAGTAEVGCGVAPDSVLADLLGLKAGEQPCPPGEGIV
jgi:hypothetical protein